MKSLYKILFAIGVLSMVTFAQEDSTSVESHEQEGCCEEQGTIFENGEWSWDESDHNRMLWDWDYWSDELSFSFDKPTISLRYGLLESSYKGLSRKLKNAGFVELELGFSERNNFSERYGSVIPEYSTSGLFLRNAKTGYGVKDDNATKLEAEYWSFGYRSSEGGGYAFDDQAGIYFANGGSISWTKLDLGSSLAASTMTPKDAELLALYDNSFRFGGSMQSSVAVYPIANAGITFNQERTIIFPRVLFWYMCGSYLLEGIGESILDEFIEEIYKSSPTVAPVVGFILKAGLSFGFSELRKDDVFWPIQTPAPLVQDHYSVSVNIAF